LGLSTEGLTRAVRLKKINVGKLAQAGANGKRSREFDADFQEIQAQSSYLLACHSHSRPGGLSSDHELKRTGRWTEEETDFVEFIVEAFDNGKLPLDQGVKLNEFLGDLLLCKSSRLTKKMKNAKLSVRSYKLKSHVASSPALHHELLSTLQDQFLRSISQEAAKLELRFHMTKVWRTYFSNLCLQVGCDMLDASEWHSSLESMDRQAAQAEENIRKARRQQMGLGLASRMEQKTDQAQDKSTDTDSSMSKRVKTEEAPPESGIAGVAEGNSTILFRSVTDVSMSTEDSVVEVDTGDNNHNLHLPEANEDFLTLINDLAEDATHHRPGTDRHLAEDVTRHRPGTDRQVRNRCASFLEEIGSYLELNDLPFEHVDVWVPSLPPTGQGAPGELRLFHAGHATRCDLDPVTFCQMQEYGEYSVKFSFAPGVGLPGRVYATGEPSWECNLDKTDPEIFVRAGGAQVYGIKTALGISLTTRIGRIVVSMYSALDLTINPAIIQKIKTDLAMYSPEPKWKLVVEIGPFAPKEVHHTAPLAASRSYSKADVAGDFENSDGLTWDHIDYRSGQDLEQLASGSHVSALTNATNVARGSACPESLPLATGPEKQVFSSQEEEHRIVTLLGDYMPLSESQASNGPTRPSSPTQDSLARHFTALRLLLLSSSRRSLEENEMLDVIKSSFRSYVKDTRRSDKELAYLLAKDWGFLKEMTEPKKPAAETRVEYQSRAMEAPAVNVSPAPETWVEFEPRAMEAPAVNVSPAPETWVEFQPRAMEAPDVNVSPAAMPFSLLYEDPSKFTHRPQDAIRSVSIHEEKTQYTYVNVVDES
jgi:hypothetical protein